MLEVVSFLSCVGIVGLPSYVQRPSLRVVTLLRPQTNAGDRCAAEVSDAFFCYVYDEAGGMFVPWGTNAELKLLC